MSLRCPRSSTLQGEVQEESTGEPRVQRDSGAGGGGRRLQHLGKKKGDVKPVQPLPQAVLPTLWQTEADVETSFLSVVTWKTLGGEREKFRNESFGRSFYISLFDSKKQTPILCPLPVSMKGSENTVSHLSYIWGRCCLVYNQSHSPSLPHPFYLTESRVPVEALPGPRRMWCDGVIA